MRIDNGKVIANIDIDDVIKAGGVGRAIESAAEKSEQIASGTIGMAFSTSGPGHGWSRTHDVADFSDRAVSDEYGALAYIDSRDGTAATRPGWTEEGTSGEHDIEWTSDSVVRIECPDIEDAMREPEFTAEMAQSVIDYHHPRSDVKAWAELIRAMQVAGEAVEKIDADDF